MRLGSGYFAQAGLELLGSNYATSASLVRIIGIHSHACLLALEPLFPSPVLGLELNFFFLRFINVHEYSVTANRALNHLLETDI